MLAHYDGEQTAVPYFRRSLSAVFQFLVYFLSFVTAFRRSCGIVFHLPLPAAARQVIEKPWIVLYGKMDCPSIFGIRIRIRYFNFVIPLANSVPSLRMVFRAYRDIIIIKGKVILIYGRSPVSILRSMKETILRSRQYS